jgi:uncharacterized SAM-binding protein YcdF (DUF218 family)
MAKSKSTYMFRKRSVYKTRWLTWTVGFLFIVWVWDLGRFSGSLEEKARGVPFEELPSVDLIAVLTGGQGRLREAFRLLESDRGRVLLISGTNASLPDILEANELKNIPNHLMERVILDPHSQRTFDNAKEIKAAVKTFGARSLLVVTSNYHMRRSLDLIQEEFAKEPRVDVVVHAYPVGSPNFDLDRWYKSFSGWRLFLSEYFKSLGTKFLPSKLKGL